MEHDNDEVDMESSFSNDFDEPLSPTPECAHCGARLVRENPAHCQGCKVTHYCCRDHQVQDRHRHKDACLRIKRSQRKLEHEETTLRNMPPDIFTPANVFEEGKGDFWGLLETRDYMRARYGMVEALLDESIRTYAAVQAALRHLLEMLVLCHSDNMGVRFKVPALMVRLNLDQVAFDFITWWTDAFYDSNRDYDADLCPAPHLYKAGGRAHPVFTGLHDELAFLQQPVNDILAPVNTCCCKKCPEISWTSILALLKIRLHLLLEIPLNVYTCIKGRLPPECLAEICAQALKYSPLSGLKALIDPDQGLDKAYTMIDQAEVDTVEIIGVGDAHNQHIWHYLLRPDMYMDEEPPSFTSQGTESEAQLALRYTLQAWVETKNSREILNAAFVRFDFIKGVSNRETDDATKVSFEVS